MDESDKYNRIAILAENFKGGIALIEVQGSNEYAYFQRMLFGASKLVTEYIDYNESQNNVRKVYSVDIVYSASGNGTDYVYHGRTEFTGMHEHDTLTQIPFLRKRFDMDTVGQLYPEYYILKVNDLGRDPKSPIEEWIYYLNTGEIPATATAPGLEEARQQLKLDSMTKDELSAYNRYLDNIAFLKNRINIGRKEGR